MSKLVMENRKNRELREKLESIVVEVCKGYIKNEVNYNIFVAGKNTGEQVAMPQKDSVAFDKIISRFEKFLGCKVELTHRNIYI